MADNKVDSKKLLKSLANQRRKIKLNDRIKLEILTDTKHYKKGQIIEPHRVFGEALISKKIAKEV